MMQDVGGLGWQGVAGRALVAGVVVIVASGRVWGGGPAGEAQRSSQQQAESSEEEATEPTPKRKLSWRDKAREAKVQATHLLDEGDLAGAARAQLDTVEALTRLLGAEHSATRWEAAQAREWEAALLKEPPLQELYLESFRAIHTRKPDQEEALDEELVGDAVIHLLDLQSVLGERSISLAVVLNRIGDSALRKKHFVEAIDCYYRCLSILESECGVGHPYAAHILSRIATGQYRLEQYEEAERSYHELIEIVREHQGERSESYVGCLLSLADLHATQGHLAEAEALLLRAYKLSKHRSITDDNLHGGIRLGLANVLARCGNFQEASEMVRFSRRHYKRTSHAVEQKLECCDRLQEAIDKASAVGQGYQSEHHDYELEWLKEEEESSSKAGKQSLAEAKLLLEKTSEQAKHYLQEGAVGQLIELQQERVAIVKEQQPSGHPRVIYEEVLQSEWQAVFELSGEEQCLYLEAVATLLSASEWHDRDGRVPDTLEPKLQDALALLENLPFESVFLFGVRNHLMSIAARRLDYEPAIDHACGMAASVERLLGPHHPNLYWTLETLASLYVEAGDLEEADRVLREIQLPLRKLLRMNSPSYVGWLYSAGTLHLRRGNLIEAEALFRQAIDLGTRMYMAHPSLRAACHCRLGDVYVAQEMIEQGSPEFDAALRICELEDVKQSTAMSRGLRTHAAVLLWLGREAEAKEKLARADAMAP